MPRREKNGRRLWPKPQRKIRLLQVRHRSQRGKRFMQNIAPPVMDLPARAMVRLLPTLTSTRRNYLNREANPMARSFGKSQAVKSRCRDTAQTYRKRTAGT